MRKKRESTVVKRRYSVPYHLNSGVDQVRGLHDVGVQGLLQLGVEVALEVEVVVEVPWLEKTWTGLPAWLASEPSVQRWLVGSQASG